MSLHEMHLGFPNPRYVGPKYGPFQNRSDPKMPT